MSAVESRYIDEASIHDYYSTNARLAGEIVQTSERLAGQVVLPIAALGTGTVRVAGIVGLPAATGVTFALGDEVWWDYSANTAIAASSAILEDFYVGRAVIAKVSGELEVKVGLNFPRSSDGQLGRVLQTRIYEFDCETGVDSAAHTLLPAGDNKTGLILLGAYGIVTEQFAGTEDQGIVTISDSDGNSLGTLTASNAGADALGDVIVGTLKVLGATTGDATGRIAAGKGITGAVTQPTTGSAAGKMKVFCLVAPYL